MTRLLFDNPAPLFLLVCFLCLFLLKRTPDISSRRLLRVGAACGALSALTYLTIIALNINRPGLLWHDEANILSISAAYVHGQPLYHPMTGGLFYSLFYGPTTFLVYVPLFARFKEPLAAIHAVMFLVALVDLVLLYSIGRKWLSHAATLALLPVAIAFLLAYPGILLGIRGDIWLLLCMAGALLVAVRWWPSGWFAASFIAGVLSGIAIDVKGTMVPVACLLMAILYRRFGRHAAALFGVACAAAALGIFAIPQISLHNYLGWLVISGHQRFLPSTCLSNVLAAVLLLSPLWLVSFFGERTDRRIGLGRTIPALLFLAMAVCILTGSKDGAGGWHLWALLPFALLGAAHTVSLRDEDDLNCDSTGASETPGGASQTARMLAVMAIAGTCVALYFGAKDLRVVRPAGNSAWRVKEQVAQAELASILAQDFHGKNLSMGYGAAVTDYRSDLRYELPMARYQYFFDENAVVEGIKAHLAIPADVRSRILGCQDVWIIPHDDEPFSAMRRGVLPVSNTPYIFPDDLRMGFAQTHRLFQQGQVYDLWKCPSGAEVQ